MPRLARSEWYDLTRDMNWTLSYVAGIGEARMGRFGRAAAWRNMAMYGTLDETRHGRIQSYFPYTLLDKEPRMDEPTRRSTPRSGRHSQQASRR